MTSPWRTSKNFRQLHSRCPGHPEYGLTPGVETTTGPLGQGAANSVGMAIAEKWLAAYFNRPGYDLIDYSIFALAGDGCLMEGITAEAASLAGHLGLDNLVWLYDNNHITIEGKTSLAFSEDVGARFRAYGWNVQHVSDANDLATAGPRPQGGNEEEGHAGADHRRQPYRLWRSDQAGYGRRPRLPARRRRDPAAKKFYGWDPEKKFFVPEEVADHARQIQVPGTCAKPGMGQMFERTAEEYPELAAQLTLIRERQVA